MSRIVPYFAAMTVGEAPRPSRKTDPRRTDRRAAVTRMVSFFAGLALVVIALHLTGLGINITDSMPIGLYHVAPVDRAPVKGDIVSICAPPAVAAIARARDYIPRGSCPDDTAPMLKIVGAVAGDVIEVEQNAIVIDGYTLPGSATHARDSHGRALSRFPRGTHQMRPGEVWLWTPNPRSWDSRYYGPLPAQNVNGFATLLFAFWDWPYARAH